MSDADYMNPRKRRDSESYYVSITDLLLGLLFIFIILLTYFASALQDAAQDLLSTQTTRNELLRRIEATMSEQGYVVTVDEEKGSISIAGETLFDSGQRDLTEEGRTVIAALSGALALHLPCYSHGLPLRPEANCDRAPHTVETVLIEGHTDDDQIRPGSWISNNLDLSSARAASTFAVLLDTHPELDRLISRGEGESGAQPIFSVAGYADRRPTVQNDSPEGKSQNRRIELRFIMATPRPEDSLLAVPENEEWERLGERDPVRLGQTLRFQSGASSDAYLDAGWARPEPDWVWSNGGVARLVFPLDSRAGAADLQLRIRGIAYVVEASTSRRVDVFVGDTRIDTWDFRYPENVFRKTLTIPRSARPDEGELVVEFRFPDAVSPASLGLSGDLRSLGLALRSVQIRRAR